MWAFLSRRFRTWVLFVVGLPILAKVLGRLADALEARRGPSSRIAGAVRSAGDLAGRTRRPRRRRRFL